MPFDKPNGPMIVQCGPEAAPANLSARQAKERGLLTSGTFGPLSIGLSKSAVLQSSLESRLRARLSILGSTLYKLTWKPWTTPSGRSRSRLRASALRTSATAFTGWPTTLVNDSLGSTHCYTGWNLNGTRKIALKLPGAAKLAGWGIPLPNLASGTPEGFLARKEKAVAKGSQMGVSISDLNMQVQAWVPHPQPARLKASGEILTGSCAEMHGGGQLNPAHSRWLMGLPPEWDACGVTAMQSARKPQKCG